MRVAHNLTIGTQLRRRGKVICICIHEISHLHVFDCQLDCEILVRRYGTKVLRLLKFGCGHFVYAGNLPHRDWVTRAIRNLCTIREGPFVNAEVDEVVGGGIRRSLARFRDVLHAITIGSLIKYAGIKGLEKDELSLRDAAETLTEGRLGVVGGVVVASAVAFT